MAVIVKEQKMKAFRLTSMLEGISYLLILCVTFGVIARDYIFPLGIVHGALFIGYFLFSLQISHKRNWSIVVWFLMLVASVVPFAFLLVELFLRKEMSRMGEATASLD